MDTNHSHCANCGIPVDPIIANEFDYRVMFCSYGCFNEYRLCDGGDDDYYSDESTYVISNPVEDDAKNNF